MSQYTRKAMPSAHEQGYIDRSLRPRTCHATHSMLLRSSVVSNPGTGSPGPETGFSEVLQSAVVQYQNRAITSAQVIEELIKLAKEVREAERRGDELGLAHFFGQLDELFDHLRRRDGPVLVLDDGALQHLREARLWAGTPSPRITYYAAPQKHRVRCVAGTWSKGAINVTLFVRTRHCFPRVLRHIMCISQLRRMLS